MRVEIDQIKSYDGNIQLVRNPKYNDLAHRIATRGQEGELPITRRPGESFYMIAKGGNTRLEIILKKAVSPSPKGSTDRKFEVDANVRLAAIFILSLPSHDCHLSMIK